MKIIKVREINMRGIKDKKTGGMNLKKPKISLVLIFTIILSMFMIQGFFSPDKADAVVALLDSTWSTQTSATGTQTNHTYTAPAGTDRVVVVFVAGESASVAASGLTVGGSAAQLIGQVNGGNSYVSAWYRIIGTSASTTASNIVVTWSTAPTTDTTITAATYSGVFQGQNGTWNASNAVNSAGVIGTAANATIVTPAAIVSVADGLVLVHINENGAAAVGTTTSAGRTFTIPWAFLASSNTNAVKQSSLGAFSATVSHTVVGGRGTMVAYALNPASTCGAVTPTSLALGTVTPTSVGLTWTTNAGNNYYNVYRNGTKISTDGAVTTGAYTDSTVGPDTIYNATGYTVTGYNTTDACESTASSAVTVNTPSVTPVAPTVNNPQLTSLDVTINAESPANPSTTTYAIRINGGAYTNQYVQAGGTVGASAVWQAKTTWGTRTVTGLANGTTYTFDIQARNQALTTTAWGATANGTTVSPCAATAPTALAASAGTTSTSIPLTWTAGANADYYNVYRNAVKISTNGAVTGTTFTDSTASPSVTYAYTVKGYNTAGTCESPVSNTLNKSTLAAVPGAPVVVNMNATSALVDIGTDTNSTEATYAIRITSSVYPGGQYVQAGGTIGASAVWQTKAAWGSKLVTGLTSVLCTFDVKARNGNGELLETAFGATASVTPHVALPSTITSCSGCHGYGATLTDGSARNVPDGKFPGSHNKHVNTYSKACSVCHVVPASEASADFNHRNGNIQMASPINGDTGAAYVKGTTWTQTSSPSAFTGCTSTYCHSNGTSVSTGTIPANTSINWGTSATCGSCHGADATGRPAYANDTPKKNSHQAATHAGTSCDKCHYATTTNGTTIASVSTHNNGTYNLDANTGAGVAFTYVYNAGGGTCSSVSCHGTAQWGVTQFDCVTCHSSAMGARRIIAGASGEFGLAWGHKKSGQGAVTKFDCTVCHMEGTAGTGAPNATYHANGTIELRDPDTGTTIQGVTWNGATPGAYTSTGSAYSFTSFSRNLASATLEPAVQAIMINHCLKCHDSNGALSANAQVPTTGSAIKPFGTTVASTNTYFNYGVAAGQGGVVDVASSFATTNASYHPVTGKQNNSYADIDRLKTPWNTTTKTIGTNTGWGPLMSCWDCHAPTGTASTVTLTSTVTAHGGASTIRADSWAAATAAAPNLCTLCHVDLYGVTNGTMNHGANSAFATGGSGTRYNISICTTCHSSFNNSRPWRGVDAHGFNLWAELRSETLTPANSDKSGGLTTGHRPYGFLRTTNMKNFNPNTVPAADGTWTVSGNKPGCVRASALCGNAHGVTGPGGVY